jgi:bla regulator protein BlaR1
MFAVPIASTQIKADLDELKLRAGVRRNVPVLTSGAIVSPAVTGLWRPRILLPVGALDDFSRSQLRWIIAHELAHIHRTLTGDD